MYHVLVGCHLSLVYKLNNNFCLTFVWVIFCLMNIVLQLHILEFRLLFVPCTETSFRFFVPESSHIRGIYELQVMFYLSNIYLVIDSRSQRLSL